MATLLKTLLLVVACSVTLVAARSHHRHRHGFEHLKKRLHRLHLKHLKEKLLTTLMPTTMRPDVTTEEYKVPTTPMIPPKHLLAEAELDQKSDAGLLDSQPVESAKDLELNLATEKTDIVNPIWGKPVKQPKNEKWVNYDELKKEFRYDDDSALPILDKPIYDDDNDVIERGAQPKGFSPVAMPKRFVSYDKNRDGFISVKELQKVTGAEENSAQAFKDTDKDGDGYISPTEFMSAPWMLEEDPDQFEQLEETRSFLKTRMKELDDEPSMEDSDNVYAEDWYPLSDDK